MVFSSCGLLLDPVFTLPPCVDSWPVDMTAALSLTPCYLLENRLTANTLLPWAVRCGNANTPRKLFLLLMKKRSRLWVKMESGVKALVCVLLCLTRSLYVSVTVHQMIKMEMMEWAKVKIVSGSWWVMMIAWDFHSVSLILNKFKVSVQQVKQTNSQINIYIM